MSTEIIFEVKRSPPHTPPVEAAAKTCPPRPEPDINATLDGLRDMIPKIRNAITEVKDAKVRVKDWVVTVGNVDEQYILNLSLKLAVKPTSMQQD